MINANKFIANIAAFAAKHNNQQAKSLKFWHKNIVPDV